MATMTNTEATTHLEQMIKVGNVVFLNNNNEVNTIASELDALDSEYAMDVVCDYSEFSFFGIAEVIATGEEAVGIYIASRGDEYEHITLCKYADPVDEEVFGIDTDDAIEICSEDPGLIYLVA